jgi:DNA polymerase-3 subunit alpha
VKTYEMLSRGEVVGVFQVESAGMRKALIGMKPDRYRGHHRAGRALPPRPDGEHPDLQCPQAWRRGNRPRSIRSIDHLVKETNGVIVYQEQVMQIAQELAGYSLGEADLLRRAMGKKIKRRDGRSGALRRRCDQRGVKKPQADFIFDLLGQVRQLRLQQVPRRRLCLVSYQTAWMKAHYPPSSLPRR